ncbi:MAG TPA: type II secretion system F family protein [Phycisphaerales bacterium]|nr:type II secretion system F family protein [Phycisphaerales bacterium]
MKFSYVAFDVEGKRFEDAIDSPNEEGARRSLSDRGLFVVELSRGAGRPAAAGGAARPGRRMSRAACLAEFTRQMSILVSTGTPLVQALGAVERQVLDARFGAMLADVRMRIEEGSTLADAMAEHPRYFDAVARSLVSAGEASGKLDAMLQRLAVIIRQQEVTRRSLAAAMSYPVLLISIAGVVLVAMLLFIIPRFAVLFESLDTPLPASTAFLMGASQHLRGHWVYELPIALGAVVCVVLWLKSAAGRRALDTWSIRAPLISRLVVSLAMARMARLLGVLLESRVPLLEALSLTKQAMANHHYARLLEEIEESVTQGSSMSAVVGRSALISPAFAEAVRSGEESGQVGRVLVSLAEYMEEDNALLVKSVTQLLEPVVLIILGLVVGIVAVSMFLPLFDATAATHSGGAGA